jgi:SAM-dependent methyltransferase
LNDDLGAASSKPGAAGEANAAVESGAVVESDAVVAPDGSPVLVYRLLPPAGEPEIVHAAIRNGASVLELGAGAGRVTHPLVALGHPVTAVDDSGAMLAEIHGARTVRADIAELELAERFDAVLLGSHLLNDPNRAGAFLATARRHIADGGIVLAEVYPPDLDWGATVGRASSVGPVTITVTRATVHGQTVDAEVAYEVDGRRWSQPFTAVVRDEADLRDMLASAGLAFDHWLDRSRGWLGRIPGPGPAPSRRQVTVDPNLATRPLSPDDPTPRPPGSPVEVRGAALRHGLTSFGAPVAHLG